MKILVFYVSCFMHLLDPENENKTILFSYSFSIITYRIDNCLTIDDLHI